MSGAWKWSCGVLAPNGKIYCIPLRATDFLIIDPSTGIATRSSLGMSAVSGDKWDCGTIGADGKIYGFPADATTLLKINPETDVAITQAIGAFSGYSQFSKALIMPSGKILAIPNEAISFAELDTETGTIVRNSRNVPMSYNSDYAGGALAP